MIDQKISKNKIGVYLLGKYSKGHFEIKYVGRSDNCLRSRLKNHTSNGEHTHFSVIFTNTIFESFRRECLEWHNRGACLCNQIHPDAPRNIPYVCPYCNTLSNFEIIAGGC
jgi:hypothetical protein